MRSMPWSEHLLMDTQDQMKSRIQFVHSSHISVEYVNDPIFSPFAFGQSVVPGEWEAVHLPFPFKPFSLDACILTLFAKSDPIRREHVIRAYTSVDFDACSLQAIQVCK